MYGGEHLVKVGERRVEQSYRPVVMFKAQSNLDTILIRLRITLIRFDTDFHGHFTAFIIQLLA